MTVSSIALAEARLREMEPSIQGQNGSAAAMRAAVALVRGFALDESTALRLMVEVYNPMCQPQWTEKELRHKVEDAARSTKVPLGCMLPEEKRDTFTAAKPKRTDRPEPLPVADYHNVATVLLQACGDFTEIPDVYEYMDRRVLVVQGARSGIGALPPIAEQGPIIQRLLKTFYRETLERAGLLWKGGKDNFLARPCHRFIIPWRAPDGSISVLQRRRLDDGSPKYLFPPGMRPRYPFGAEELRASDASWPLVFCEGAIDVLALRLIRTRDRHPMVPLGLPGLDGWSSDWSRWAKGREALIAVDTDSTGEEHAQRIADDLFNAGASKVSRWRPTPAKDWAELIEQGAA